MVTEGRMQTEIPSAIQFSDPFRERILVQERGCKNDVQRGIAACSFVSSAIGLTCSRQNFENGAASVVVGPRFDKRNESQSITESTGFQLAAWVSAENPSRDLRLISPLACSSSTNRSAFGSHFNSRPNINAMLHR